MTPVEPCRGCPWRTSNAGKRHPDGWYTKANLRRLWTAIRRSGRLNSCHPTDPGNPVSERAQDAGYRPAPDGAQVRECAGAVILAQRELQTLNDADSLRDYQLRRPLGLRPEAAMALAFRVFATDLTAPVTGPPIGRPDLNHPDVDYAPLGPWERR